MNRKTYFSIIFVMLIIAFSSCRRPAFETFSDIDHTIDFGRYNSFTMAEVPVPEGADMDVMNNGLIHRRIKNYVAEELRNKGYQELEAGGDLLVRYHKVVQDRRETETRYQPMGMGMGMGYWGGWWGRPWGWGWGNPYWGGPWMGSVPYTHIREFVEGQVIVNVYDHQTNELVWQGWARGEIRRYRRTMADRDQAVRDKVAEIMANFPVNTRPQETEQPAAAR